MTKNKRTISIRSAKMLHLKGKINTNINCQKIIQDKTIAAKIPKKPLKNEFLLLYIISPNILYEN